MVNAINLIAAAVTIVSATISLMLWVRSKERNRWLYANYQTILEGLTNIVVYTRSDDKAVSEATLRRVGDMAFNLHDNVVSALLTLDRKRTERLKSWDYGYRNEEEKAKRLKDVNFTYSSLDGPEFRTMRRSELRGG